MIQDAFLAKSWYLVWVAWDKYLVPSQMAVPDWHKRLVCGHCGSHNVDMLVTGTER